jgi:single-strand DNA-binding protein
MSQTTFAVVSGNLGRDPETRYLPSGNSVTTFSVASNSVWKDKAGVQQKKTTWTPVQVWGKFGEAIAKNAKKGRYVTVHGQLVGREIKRQDNSTYYRLELKAQSVDFGPRAAVPTQTEEELPPMNEQDDAMDLPSDEDIPV